MTYHKQIREVYVGITDAYEYLIEKFNQQNNTQISIVYEWTRKGLRGSYDHSYQEILISKSIMHTNTGMSTFWHELEHAKQHLEEDKGEKDWFSDYPYEENRSFEEYRNHRAEVAANEAAARKTDKALELLKENMDLQTETSLYKYIEVIMAEGAWIVDAKDDRTISPKEFDQIKERKALESIEEAGHGVFKITIK